MGIRYQRQTEIIRQARKATGYSQQQVASIIGVHIRQYQRIECGERDIRYASMKLGLSICSILGIDPFMLVLSDGTKRTGTDDRENFQDTTERTLLENQRYGYIACTADLIRLQTRNP